MVGSVKKVSFDKKLAQFHDDLRDRIDTLVKTSGIGSRRGLSKQLPISEDMLSKLLRGERSWKIAHLIQVADALGVSLKELLAGETGVRIPLFRKGLSNWQESYERVLSPPPDCDQVRQCWGADYAFYLETHNTHLCWPRGTVVFFRRNYDGPLGHGDVVNYVNDLGLSCLMTAKTAGPYLVLSCPIEGICDDLVFKPGSRPIDLRVGALYRAEASIVWRNKGVASEAA